MNTNRRPRVTRVLLMSGAVLCLFAFACDQGTPDDEPKSDSSCQTGSKDCDGDHQTRCVDGVTRSFCYIIDEETGCYARKTHVCVNGDICRNGVCVNPQAVCGTPLCALKDGYFCKDSKTTAHCYADESGCLLRRTKACPSDEQCVAGKCVKAGECPEGNVCDEANGCGDIPDCSCQFNDQSRRQCTKHVKPDVSKTEISSNRTTIEFPVTFTITFKTPGGSVAKIDIKKITYELTVAPSTGGAPIKVDGAKLSLEKGSSYGVLFQPTVEGVYKLIVGYDLASAGELSLTLRKNPVATITMHLKQAAMAGARLVVTYDAKDKDGKRVVPLEPIVHVVTAVDDADKNTLPKGIRKQGIQSSWEVRYVKEKSYQWKVVGTHGGQEFGSSTVWIVDPKVATVALDVQTPNPGVKVAVEVSFGFVDLIEKKTYDVFIEKDINDFRAEITDGPNKGAKVKVADNEKGTLMVTYGSKSDPGKDTGTDKLVLFLKGDGALSTSWPIDVVIVDK